MCVYLCLYYACGKNVCVCLYLFRCKCKFMHVFVCVCVCVCVFVCVCVDFFGKTDTLTYTWCGIAGGRTVSISCLQSLQGHLSSVRGVASTPSGLRPNSRLLFSGGGRASVKAWLISGEASIRSHGSSLVRAP